MPSAFHRFTLALTGAALLTLLPGVALAQAAKPAAAAASQPAKKSPGAGPVIVIDTAKGTVEFETYPEDAPKSVEHILKLVKKNFYSGLRVHRVEPGFVVQFGDKKTRDVTKKAVWGRGPDDGSGEPVGVAEFSKKRLNVRGAVALAHSGDAKDADSQMFILLGDRPALNGKYAVIGQVISGMDVVTKLQIGDVIKKLSVKP